MNTEVHETLLLADLQRTLSESDKFFHEARLKEKQTKWYGAVSIFGAGGVFSLLIAAAVTVFVKWWLM